MFFKVSQKSKQDKMDDMDAIIENEREWRRHLFTEMKELKKEVGELQVLTTTLKIKYGFLTIAFGFLGGLFGSLLNIKG